MNTIPLVLVSAAALLAVGTPAQHPMGFTAASDGATISHGPSAVGALEGDFLTRIDNDDYSRWGLDPFVDPSYGTWCVVGIEFVLQDPNPATGEAPAWVTGWTEDPNLANFPHLAGFDPTTGGSNFLFAGPVPASPFAATAWSLTLGPGFCVPTDQDIFLGVNIGPVGTGEGLTIQAVADSSANPVEFDNPGPAGASIPAGSYVCNIPTNTPPGFPPFPTGGPAVYTPYRSQSLIEVILENASGGVCTATTNQMSYPASGPAGDGSPSFLSGLHPDAASTPVNAGRSMAPPAGWTGDQIGFIYTDSRLQAGDPVVVVVAFATENPPVPLTMFSGAGLNPTGQVLVSLAGVIPIGSGLAQPVVDANYTYTRFAMTIDLAPIARNRLVNRHPTLLWQGFGLDAAFNIHASGLARQHF